MDEVAALEANQVASGVALARAVPGGEVTSVGTVLVITTALPPPGFNGVIAFGHPALHDLVAGVALVRARGVEPMVRLSPDADDALAGALGALGLVEAESQAGMAMELTPGASGRASDLRIVRVGPDELGTFCDTLADGFGLDPGAVRRAFPPAMVASPMLGSWLGWAGGRPVATASLVLSGTVAGVYSVSTVPAYRRLGYGEAMTWAAMLHGRDRGATLAVLEASRQGEPVYRAMGFREVVRHRTFVAV